MKHERSTEGLIAAGLDAAGIDVPARVIDALALHLEAVLRANERFNLTSVDGVEEAVELHVVDSLTALAEVRIAPPGAEADLGSGAGYPGIPLALAGGRRTTLVESVGKKAEFLRDVASKLAGYADLAVAHSRAETLATEEPGAFSVITARALSSLPSLVELASPLLSEDGVFLALKGPLTPEESERGVAAGRLVGMEFEGTREIVLPGGYRRTIVSFRRTGVPQIGVPRRPGRAQRKPLK